MTATLLSCLLQASFAAEVRSLTVERDGDKIRVRSDIVLAAPQASVFGALSDYERFAELSSRYEESRFVEPASDGTQRVYTRVEGCVLFFCRTVERYARLETEPPRLITATVEAERSDFEFGYETWEMETVTGGTRVLYTHDFDPDFWVPPVIGVWVIRRALNSDSLKAAERIEALAREQGKAP